MTSSGKILAWVFCALAVLPAAAQNEIDVYRYSESSVTGTARAIGAGGAFSAVGADFTAAFLNPAGLGLYRKSEFEMTPSFRSVNNSTRYMGQTTATPGSRFGFTNAGYVITGAGAGSGDTKGKIKSWSLGIGYNQKANFKRNTDLSVYNNDNSITDYFAAQAQGQNYSDIEAGYTVPSLAWWAVLIDTAGADDVYQPAVVGGHVQQTLHIEETGRNNQWAISAAGNIDDKIYVGFTLGISDLKYSADMLYSEEDINNVHQAWTSDSTPFNQLAYVDYYQTKGTGVDARLGVIVRPTDFLRFGVSVQSPTWHSMRDKYYYSVEAQFDGTSDNFGTDPVQGSFSYNLTTPYKVTFGGMLLVKKMGFLTADFEITDYASGRLSTSGGPSSSTYYSFASENASVRQLFGPAYNLRMGGEVRLDIFRFRAGYSRFGSVLKPDYQAYVDYPSGTTVKYNGGRNIYTGGIGIKQESYYLDLAFAHETTADKRLFYTVEDPTAYSPELVNKLTTNLFLMTIGFTF